MKQALIIGSGLTGPVLALYLVRLGYQVSLYERGPDPRETKAEYGKSINITLAERGLHALELIGLRQVVQQASVSVNGRVIHHRDGRLEQQTYGNFGEALWSISRFTLNQILIAAAAEEKNISLQFGHECIDVDLNQRSVLFRQTNDGRDVRRNADFIIGADGANSRLRMQFQRRSRFQYSQSYSNHANKELRILGDANASWMEHRHALHMWPRGDHMLISFPNLDGSITCTLHMPYEGRVSFESIKSAEQIRSLFASDFGDALPYIDQLEKSYEENPLIPMVTVRCSPWSVNSNALLIGDAAHAIWPSYGQGANLGFEDCRILAECMSRSGDDLSSAFIRFEEIRRPMTDALAKLSEDHFYEIREKVSTTEFQLRKRIELKLNRANPRKYQSLYGLISFSTAPYGEALAQQQLLDAVVDQIISSPEAEHDSFISQILKEDTVHASN